ncbi:MAG TPA: hypothetical protein VHZ26_09045 [Caulobacteraceae bacterium]|jgi:hypothetical protein|nr:hypothetical protein [Caulobacteraceae bacterium]
MARAKINGIVAVETGDQRWDRCAGWLAAALAYEDGRRSMADLFSAYRTGQMVLFDAPQSAMLVELLPSSNGRLLNILLAGGRMDEVDQLRAQAETWGIARGCVAAVVVGRRGWLRAWRRYGYVAAPMIERWHVATKTLSQGGRHREAQVTAINVSLSPYWAGVASDTLVTGCGDREFAPVAFSSKVLYLPHLKMMLASTGAITIPCHLLAAAQMCCGRDVTEILSMASELCRREFANSRDFLFGLHPEDDRAWIDDATAYLIGWSNKAGRFVGYRLQARSDFAPQPMTDGLYLHPQVPKVPPDFAVDAAALVALTRHQWTAELRKLRDDRNAIGGDLCVQSLRWDSQAGVVFESRIAERFSTYEADLTEMRAREPVR